MLERPVANVDQHEGQDDLDQCGDAFSGIARLAVPMHIEGLRCRLRTHIALRLEVE